MMLVIYGPTATSKTALAIKLAQKYNGELTSADSRQVYRGLDIGTGKVSFDSKIEKHKGFWIVDGVKVNGFDLVNPGRRFSVADFLRFSSTTLFRISETNKLPIVVGGTGFYIKALIDGIESIGIKPDMNLRRKLEKLNTSDLYQKLFEVDPKRAQAMNESDRQNPRRLIRAIEIAIHKRSTSEESPSTSLRASKPTSEVFYGQLSDVNCLIVGLTAPNNYLYHRSDQWLEGRLSHGLIDEIKNLLNQKVSPLWLDNLGLEYRWLTRYLLGKVTKEEAIIRLKGDIHNFIRRQKTWFKKFPKIKLFDISQPNWQTKLENRILLLLRQ